MSEVINLCDSPSPAKAKTKTKAARKNDHVAADFGNAGGTADGITTGTGAKRAKLEPAPAALAGGNENYDSDSDVEFVDPTAAAAAAATTATAKKKSNVGGGNRNSNNVLMNSPLLNSPAVRARARTGQRKDDRMYDRDDDDDDNDDGKKKSAGNAKKKDGADDSDDKLEIVGTKGVSALIDFPHSRENCLTHRFRSSGSGSTDKNIEHCRDRQIREFQEKRGPSRLAVFVITMRAGSVGITLTAASHCFLMEPCLDPATEIQAAGRIHRLGQTKHVHVTKFVYSRSSEENVQALHGEIAAGRINIVDNQVSTAAVSLLARGLIT